MGTDGDPRVIPDICCAKVLEAYMDKAKWPTQPLRAYLTTMLWVGVLLLRQHDENLKYGLS